MKYIFLLIGAFFINTYPLVAQEGKCLGTAERQEGVFWNIREQMPYLLLKTEGATTVGEYRDQTNQLLLKFICSHLRYPPTSRNTCVSGTVVVSFTIGIDGLIDPESIVCKRDIGGGFGEEAIRVMKLMADLKWQWVPGKQGGVPVPIQFNVPIKIRLE